MEDAECLGPLPLGWALLPEKQCSGLVPEQCSEFRGRRIQVKAGSMEKQKMAKQLDNIRSSLPGGQVEVLFSP